MADEKETSVRDDILASIKELGEDNEPPVAAEPDRSRDEQGRFAAKADAGEPGVPEDAPRDSGKRTEEPVLSAPEKPVAAQDPQLAAAPATWSNAVKAEWPKLPESVRSEILKREADVHKGITRYDEERAFAKEVQKTVAPYEALIRSAGVSIPQAIGEVMNTAYILRTADPMTKAREIANVCRVHGVDLRLLAQPQAEVPPQVAALQQRLAQLEGQLSQQQQADRAKVENEVLTAVETFSQDPKHPHFKAVSAHMGALMQAGEAKDMEQAYEMAVWARPDLRAQLLAAQTQSQQVRQKTEKARAKAVSVRGGPGGYTPPAANPNQTVRESIMAAVQEVNERI